MVVLALGVDGLLVLVLMLVVGLSVLVRLLLFPV